MTMSYLGDTTFGTLQTFFALGIGESVELGDLNCILPTYTQRNETMNIDAL